MRYVREAPGPRRREVEPGGDGLGGDGTGLIEVPKILPLSVFRSTQRFGKEDFGAGDPTLAAAGLTLGMPGFGAVIRAEWKERPRPAGARPSRLRAQRARRLPQRCSRIACPTMTM